jgi:hypothetical protein
MEVEPELVLVLLILLVEPGNSELLLPLVLAPLLVVLGNRELELRLMGADADPPPVVPPGAPPKLPADAGAPPCWA